MKILIRDQNDQRWHTVQSISFQNESELQKLIAGDPSLISISEMREDSGSLVYAVREFPVDIGQIDILGFTEYGEIIIIECKLASNQEVKRKVIGQVLEYGSALWNISYDELNSKIQTLTGSELINVVAEKIQNPTWDKDLFKQNITRNLSSGNFVLIIVVDQINDELSRIIQFINAAGSPSFSLAALEMQKYQHEGTEMLVPHVFGMTPGGIHQPKKNKSYDESLFLDEARQKNDERGYEIIKDVYLWSRRVAQSIKFGITTIGTFTAYFSSKENISSVFTVYSDGSFYFNFSYMEKIYSAEEIEKFKTLLAEIPEIHSIIKAKWQQTSLSVSLTKGIKEAETLTRIKSVIESFTMSLK